MTFNTLLIPTDGSDTAERAARRGFDLAAALGASVHVLSVADSSVATGAGYSGDSASIRRKLRAKAEIRATRLRDEATGRGLEATAVTREGIPAKQILEYADEDAVDAIAIGTSGRGGVARALIGSVADKVVRMASVPVITIPTRAVDDGAHGVESILLPTDGSEAATVAARLGIELAATLEATVHLLSVADSNLERALAGVIESDGPDSTDRLLEVAGDHLGELATEASAGGLEYVTVTTQGAPGAEIVAYAESEDIDLIAMGTAGRGGFERALVGSVTDEVVRTSPTPVLTVRTDDGR